jgi:hypothetical protein
MSASFVSFILALSGLIASMLTVSPWTESILPKRVPEAAPENFYDYKDSSQFLPKRTKLAPGRHILCLGLLAAVAMADSIPSIDLQAKKHFKKSVRSSRGRHGFLMTANLKDATIEQLRVVLEASKVHLLQNDDYFELIMDSGCSKICTGHDADFVPGSLVDLHEPMCMDGIAGMLTSHKKGRVRYEVINDSGGLSILECEAYYLPALKFRLFSPQVFLQEPQEQGGEYQLRWDRSVLELQNGDKITIGYHRQTALPVLRAFSNSMNTAKSLASITSDSNINLTSSQYTLYGWHTRWGHLGFQHCQWLGRTGIVGTSGVKMGSTTSESRLIGLSCDTHGT